MLKKFLLVISSLAVLLSPLAVPSIALADAKTDICAGVDAASGDNSCASGDGSALSGAVKTALTIMQIVAGLLAIFYMVYAGIKFITSTGSSDGVKSAKNTILYASIGLVVVAISEAIIQFVLKRFG